MICSKARNGNALTMMDLTHRHEIVYNWAETEDSKEPVLLNMEWMPFTPPNMTIASVMSESKLIPPKSLGNSKNR